MICPGTIKFCDNPGCRHGGCQGRYPSGMIIAMAAPMVTCTTCSGSGTVPHQKRTLGTDSSGSPIIDPHDHQIVELCHKCGGSGKMISTPSA